MDKELTLAGDNHIKSSANLSFMPALQKKETFIRDIKSGDPVCSLFSVKEKRPPHKYAKGFVFELLLSDRSGEMILKYWGSNDQAAVTKVYESFKANDVVQVKGCASTFRDRVELAVNEDGGAIAAVPRALIDIGDFVERPKVDPEKLMTAINKLVKSVQDPQLRSVLGHFFQDEGFVLRFREAPGSMMLHCNWIGGLAEHTLKVAQICDYIASQYPDLDRDLLIAGALLHDIGKVEEYSVGTNIDITEDGMLRGHIVIGAEMVARACEDLDGIPERLRLKLVHMVLSSHGELEFGSPKRPQFPEAFVVNHADDLDAKLEQFIKVKKEARTEDPWVYDKRFGNVFLR